MQKLKEKLKNIWDHRELVYGGYLESNSNAITFIERLHLLGLTENAMGRRVGVGGAHICKIWRGVVRVSAGLTTRLESAFDRACQDLFENLKSQSHNLAAVIGASKGPDVPLDSVTKERIASAVVKAVVTRCLTNRISRIQLPSGIIATVITIDEDLVVIALDREQCTDAAGSPLAHELEAAGDHLLRIAGEVRGATQARQARPLPKKWG